MSCRRFDSIMSNLLANEDQEGRDSKRRLSIFAPEPIMQQLDRIAGELHYKTRTRTLQFLTQFYNETQHSDKGLPVATFDAVMKHDAPVVLCGIPGSGKSFTLDAFLKDCRKRSIPFLLFNSDNRDHAWLTNELEWTDIVSLRWLDTPAQYIVKLPHDLDCQN